MIDREMTINALKCCSLSDAPKCRKCPKDGPGFGFICRDNLMNEALALLNEHERRWKELRSCITEMSTNGGTGSQQDVCRYLAHLMDVIEGVKT